MTPAAVAAVAHAGSSAMIFAVPSAMSAVPAADHVTVQTAQLLPGNGVPPVNCNHFGHGFNRNE
jgi:predicted amidohydrolase